MFIVAKSLSSCSHRKAGKNSETREVIYSPHVTAGMQSSPLPTLFPMALAHTKLSTNTRLLYKWQIIQSSIKNISGSALFSLRPIKMSYLFVICLYIAAH